MDNFKIFLILVFVKFSSASDIQSQRVKQLYLAGDVCDSNEGSWMPLPEGVKCGTTECSWPIQMCTIRKGKSGIPELKCGDISKTCQDLVYEAYSTQQVSLTPISTSTKGPEHNMMKKDEVHKSPLAVIKNIKGDAAPSPPAQCTDGHELCCYWAMKGECDNNPGFMRIVCQKACGTCGCKSKNVKECTVKINLQDCPQFIEHSGEATPIVQSGCSPGGCNSQSGNGGQQYQQSQTQPCGSGLEPGGGPQAVLTDGSGPACPPTNALPCGSGGDCPKPAKPCQRGIFPAAGGGCGANQYGGRGGCGDDGSGCGGGQEAPVQIRRPPPSAVQQPAQQQIVRPIGPAPSPTLGSGCKDFMQACSSVTSGACKQSAFMGNVCQQTCKKC